MLAGVTTTTQLRVSPRGTYAAVQSGRSSPSDHRFCVAGGEQGLAVHDFEHEVHEDVGNVDPSEPRPVVPGSHFQTTRLAPLLNRLHFGGGVVAPASALVEQLRILRVARVDSRELDVDVRGRLPQDGHAKRSGPRLSTIGSRHLKDLLESEDFCEQRESVVHVFERDANG